MSGIKGLMFIFVISAGLLGVVSPAEAADDDETVTIVATDGTRYETDEYFVGYEYRLITFVSNGQKLSIGFDQIEAVLDSHGTDITVDVLGPVDWETGRRMSPDEWKKLWGGYVHAGINTPSLHGDYDKNLQSQLGFQAEAMMSGSRSVDFRFAFVVTGIELDPDNERTFNAWEYYIAIQYHTRPKLMTAGNFFLYGYGGVGGISYRGYEDNNRVPVYSESCMIVTAGGGLVFLLSSSVGLDFGLGSNLLVLFAEESDQNQYFFDSVRIVEFKLGFVLMI